LVLLASKPVPREEDADIGIARVIAVLVAADETVAGDVDQRPGRRLALLHLINIGLVARVRPVTHIGVEFDAVERLCRGQRFEHLHGRADKVRHKHRSQLGDLGPNLPPAVCRSALSLAASTARQRRPALRGASLRPSRISW
jgi:hypothetical protein